MFQVYERAEEIGHPKWERESINQQLFEITNAKNGWETSELGRDQTFYSLPCHVEGLGFHTLGDEVSLADPSSHKNKQ